MSAQFKCDVCGKFISQKDIPQKLKVNFTPDTALTSEKTTFIHNKCKIK